MASKQETERTVKAVETSFAIVETIDEMGEAGISEIADELSIAKSTAHKHLRTLERCEYVVRDGREYRLGLKYLMFGRHAFADVEIAEKSQPVIDQLAAKTGEAIWVAIEEHGRAVYVGKALGERAVPSRGGIGERIDLHSAAIGKALLSNLPSDRVDEIIERHELSAMTPNTITNRDALFDELEEIRDRGVAFNRGESLVGLRAVASPVTHDGELKGAIAIVGTEVRMRGDYFEAELPDRIRGAVNEIELNLAYS